MLGKLFLSLNFDNLGEFKILQGRIKEYVVSSALSWKVEDTCKDQTIEGAQNRPAKMCHFGIGIILTSHRLKGSMDSSLQRSQQANSHKVQWQWPPCCLQEAMTPTWPAVGTHLGKSLERGLSSTTVTLDCAPLGRSALI